jgi:UDP-N-acetylglucosamine 2-epimerase (non-hydrolysing)
VVDTIATIMSKFASLLKDESPDLVVVVGDVNSTLACSLAAQKCGVKVAHVEAGLRSFDSAMPEEINRIVTDQVSDFLLTSCMDANENLVREGVARSKIKFVGNVMIDTLMKAKTVIEKSDSYKVFKEPFVLLTLHRPSNVDTKKDFKNIAETIKKISGAHNIIFPVHPRTKSKIKQFGLSSYFHNVKMVSPMNYMMFLNHMMQADFILTDSGGIQEEASVLKVPCITLRENTERPITIEQGTNVLTGVAQKAILMAVKKKDMLKKSGKVRISKWDGKTAQRIVKVIKQVV